MRFSFKKTLATVLSIAMILSAFVGVLTTSAAAANVVGTLTMDDVTATANTENKFDVVANIALDAEASYVHVAYKLGTLPEGVALDSVASNVGTAIIDAETGAILVDAGADAVSAIAVTMTFVAPETALEAFTLAVEAVDYADVDENDDTIDITDTAVITVISHGPAADLCQGDGTHHWYPCVVEGCTEHKYGEDWHAWKTDTVTPPTCTEPGVGNKYCDCGRGWGNVEIPATGEHNYAYADNGDGTHTVTCTVGGETDVADCTFVDGVCEFCKGIEVTECAHEYVEAITTAPTCTEPGVKTFTCSKCGDSYTEPVAAKGHGELTFVSAESAELVAGGEAGKIHFTCDDCGATVTKDVLYNVRAGASTIDLSVESELLLSFEGKFTNFNRIDEANPETDTHQYEMIMVFNQSRNGEAIDNTAKATRFKSEAIKTATTYKFTYGLPAAEMCDAVTAQLYVYIPNTDQWYCGKAYSSSIVEYATTKLTKDIQAEAAGSAPNNKLRTLLVDTLNYGAAAQNYFNVNKENLANANLVIEGVDCSTFGTNTTIDAEQVFERNSFTAETPATISNPSITLEQKVLAAGDLRFGSAYRDNYADKSKLSMVIKYTDIFGKEITTTYVHADYYEAVKAEFEETDTNKLAYFVDGSAAGRYNYEFANFASTDMKATLYITGYYDGVAVSSECRWSVQSFVYDKRNAATQDSVLVTLLDEMLAYGESAKAFFS